jgi:hypothetical protein
MPTGTRARSLSSQLSSCGQLCVVITHTMMSVQCLPAVRPHETVLTARTHVAQGTWGQASAAQWRAHLSCHTCGPFHLQHVLLIVMSGHRTVLSDGEMLLKLHAAVLDADKLSVIVTLRVDVESQCNNANNRVHAPAEPRPISYADLGGIDHVLADIRELIENPLQVRHVGLWFGETSRR